jgi:hypothetical protein
MDLENNHAFAFIADGEVFHFLTIPKSPQFAGIIAGLQSRPLLVEVTDRPDMFNGGFWTYDGVKFTEKPKEQVITDPDDYEVE